MSFLTKILFKEFLIWAFWVKMWVHVGSKMAKRKKFFFIPATSQLSANPPSFA